MGGDEIVAEWLGDLDSGTIQTTTSVQRFCASSKRFKTIKFMNYTGTEWVYFGKYYANHATFLLNCFIVGHYAVTTFEYADLYEFGVRAVVNPSPFKWWGVNRY